MYFETFADFLAMGTHGPYVWSAYGLTVLVVIANLVAISRKRKQALTTIRQKLRRHEILQQELLQQEALQQEALDPATGHHHKEDETP